MRAFLIVCFAVVFAVMVAVTAIASMERGVFAAGAELWRDAWFRATLCDTYFAFLTVGLWICCRERGVPARLGWLLGVLLLGNLAIAAYFLIALVRAPGGDWRSIFPWREDPAR
jgi:hypothetical protein